MVSQSFLRNFIFTICLIKLGLGATFDGIVIGVATDGRDVVAADVFDGALNKPIKTSFSAAVCDCSPAYCASSQCGTMCHSEGHTLARHFYVQNLGKKEVRLLDPIVEFNPLCDTNVKHITLNTAATVTQKKLKADAMSTVEVDFECTTLSTDDSTGGMFDVAVTLPISTGQDQPQNITWHFRKFCKVQFPDPDISIYFDNQPVVSNGKVDSHWKPESSNVFDVGYDPNDRDITFDVVYKGEGLISYDMIKPDFDETIVKSVSYKGSVFNAAQGNSLTSGAREKLIARVNCQKDPAREGKPTSIRLGLTNIYDANRRSVNPIEFKFQIECPSNGHKISPLGVLGIVLSLYLVFGCIGGFAYNLQFTPKRGLSAIPCFQSIKSLFSSESHSYFPVVREDLDEPSRKEKKPTTKNQKAMSYGAV
eukprot:c36754_g1_i1.p1 GENE.c36754_g1_i1~~c36754_g1_i1.p1  ORF type:complete len:422 (-),score=156.09 c36754_g1_i1:39-1304(-)